MVRGKRLKVSITDTGVLIEGEVTDPVFREILQEGAQESSLEEAFSEIILLGAKVKDVIQTTATTRLLAKSVEDVRKDLAQLEEDHEGFLRDLMAEIADADSSSNLNLVKKLREWREEFDRKLVVEFDATNSEGTVSRIRSAIDEYLVKRESVVASLLSLNESADPLVPQPLKQVYEKVQAILDKLNEDKGVKRASRTSAKKGNDFESAVYNIIQAIADEYGDVADDPGRQHAIGVDGNDEGDIIVDYRFDSIKRISGKLVIESKHHNTRTAKSKLIAELEKGVSNREGDYGVIITNESGYDLNGSFPFWEDWGDRRAILVLEDDHENLDEDKIRFAYLLAKARIKDMKSNLDADTMEMVNEQIATIKKHFERIRHLKGAHTVASGALTDILNDVEYLERYVGDQLTRLHNAVSGDGENAET